MLEERDVLEITRPSLGGEDVSQFMERAPGCFFGLGGSNPSAGINSVHHNPSFQIDESIFWRGSAIFCAAVLGYLAPGK